MTHEANAELTNIRMRAVSVLEPGKLVQYSSTSQARGQEQN